MIFLKNIGVFSIALLIVSCGGASVSLPEPVIEEPTEPVIAEPTLEPTALAIDVPSPLARLTNDEFIRSIRDLLYLSDDSANIEAALDSLPPESDVAGLSSDSSVQTISQTTIFGLSNAATAAANDLLAEEDGSFENAMSCRLPFSESLSSNNLASGKQTSQSSTLRAGTEPDLAIDGNNDGNFHNDSVTHTDTQDQAWWQIDLGAVESLSHINLFNRTDCCSERLSDFHIFVSDNSIDFDTIDEGLNEAGVTSFYVGPTVDGSTTIDINQTGRYVRVQLAASELALSLAEVEIFNSVDETASTYTFDDCLEEFGSDLLSRALGRSANDEESDDLTNLIIAINESLSGITDTDNSDARSIKLNAVVTSILLNPDFLFFAEEGDEVAPIDGVDAVYLSSSEIAKRLSYFLTGTSPDELLAADAQSGNLKDAAVREQHIDRLLSSEKVSEHYFGLVIGWLGIDAAASTEEDIARINTFVAEWISGDRPFSELYNGSFDVKLTDNSTVPMAVGILGSKAFIESHTSFPSAGFIHRGEFVTDRLLCADLPDDVPAVASETEFESTIQLFHDLSEDACASCHKVFDNYGAQFQEFDDETSLFTPNNVLYGNSFDLFNIGDIGGTVDGTVTSLANSVANSDTAASCMSELLFRNAFRRSVSVDNSDDVLINAYISNWFGSGESSLKSLLKTIATSDAFITLYR